MKTVRHVTSALAEDIQSGLRQPGDQLPPHRQLAWELGCSVATVSKAYRNLERQGLIYGHVGRGTFVKEDVRAHDQADIIFPRSVTEPAGPSEIDFTLNFMRHPSGLALMQKGLKRLVHRSATANYQTYTDSRGAARDRKSGARWLARFGLTADPDDVIIAPGAQSAIYAAIQAVAGANSAIAAEAYCYPGFRAAIETIGARPIPIAMDGEGLIPSEFEKACRMHAIAALVTMPKNQNPTGVTQPLARRMEIADIAARHGVVIIEDGIYDFLYEEQIEHYIEFAPGPTLYTTSLTKAISPALRVGYIYASPSLHAKLVATTTAMNWMTSEFLVSMANDLIASSDLDAHIAALREETKYRHEHTMAHLAPWIDMNAHSKSEPRAHFWLTLPENWSADVFQAACQARQVKLLSAINFALDRRQESPSVRLCAMSPPGRSEFRKGIQIVEALLANQLVAPHIHQ